MYPFPIGVMLESFRTDIVSAIGIAADLGLDAVQMYVTKGNYTPKKMTSEKCKELLDRVRSNGLTFSAICGDLGKGFGDAKRNKLLIEETKRILDVTRELDCDVVTARVGVIPQDKTDKRYQAMQEACFEIGTYAEKVGVCYAIETGLVPSFVQKAFLDELNLKGLGVNMDPSNLVMLQNEDSVTAVHNLKDYIVHTHAKDGVFFHGVDLDVDFGLSQPGTLVDSSAYKEVPLGEGEVGFEGYLQALFQVGYRGCLTIEQEVWENPVHEITASVAYLRGLVG